MVVILGLTARSNTGPH
ncbi:unnamed protein product [Acanthoscelides obtectus]|uniref:Uncharacterized protein n=1 Tax=Acanthoscelides obtectus TaxID=200917 RepID=A0A9P0KE33_ACAOB|nr:unnamed protein product [Acanthoscelides obtectus]CAK1672684.1 hypothetical protein AOBTE_LOCUS29042 [Acanthoscelides obtectus]